MNRDKQKTLLLSLLIFAVLLASLFLNVTNSKITTAILLLPFALFTFFAIKRRSTLSIFKRDVLVIITIISIIYASLKEMTGIYFEFYENPYFVTTERLLNIILPTVVIIIASEMIRYVILAQDVKTANIVTYLSCVLSDVLIYSNIAGIESFNNFMDLVGLTLFPALSANVLCHYVSKKYGMLPNIIFRLITTLYSYFIPTTTGMNDALDSCIRIIFPIALLSFISAMYEKKLKPAVKKGKKLGVIATLLTVVLIVSVAMLISCQFRFGALVIATESMTGEINKGDMILYERYDGQKIKVGQVIVFSENNSNIVHRVSRIENIGGEARYYTKGDANPTEDYGFRTDGDIVGLTDVKIAYIGYPTLWLREMLDNSNKQN